MNINYFENIKPPFQLADDLRVREFARKKTQERLDMLVKKYGIVPPGEDGVMRFKNGEDISLRLVKDGYAVPHKSKSRAMKTACRQAIKEGRGQFAKADIPAQCLIFVRRILQDSDELTR